MSSLAPPKPKRESVEVARGQLRTKKAPKPDSYQPSNCNSYQHDRPFDLDRQYIECEVTCRGFAVGMN